MKNLIFLTEAFYQDFNDCPEIAEKENRPYMRVGVKIGGVLWAIPFRSHIAHEYAVWTNKENCCGLDLTKAVALADPERYISTERPYLRPEEFAVLKRINDHTIVQKFEGYIALYKKAKKTQEVPRTKRIVAFSTLQYFEMYI